jgi:hypothetical protein
MFRFLLLVIWGVSAASAADLLTVYHQALESDPTVKNAAIKVEMGDAQKNRQSAKCCRK